MDFEAQMKEAEVHTITQDPGITLISAQSR